MRTPDHPPGSRRISRGNWQRFGDRGTFFQKIFSYSLLGDYVIRVEDCQRKSDGQPGDGGAGVRAAAELNPVYLDASYYVSCRVIWRPGLGREALRLVSKRCAARLTSAWRNGLLSVTQNCLTWGAVIACSGPLEQRMANLIPRGSLGRFECKCRVRCGAGDWPGRRCSSNCRSSSDS
jgi:hypothetical protein